MLHDDNGHFYGFTRYPKPVSTLSHNLQKLLVSTQYTLEKSHDLLNIQADILKLVYHHPRRFLWAFRTLKVNFKESAYGISKKLRYLLLKRQETGPVSSSFPLSACHSFLSVKFLLIRSNCAKGIGKS